MTELLHIELGTDGASGDTLIAPGSNRIGFLGFFSLYLVSSRADIVKAMNVDVPSTE